MNKHDAISLASLFPLRMAVLDICAVLSLMHILTSYCPVSGCDDVIDRYNAALDRKSALAEPAIDEQECTPQWIRANEAYLGACDKFLSVAREADRCGIKLDRSLDQMIKDRNDHANYFFSTRDACVGSQDSESPKAPRLSHRPMRQSLR
jgi:hypothetical protein